MVTHAKVKPALVIRHGYSSSSPRMNNSPRTGPTASRTSREIIAPVHEARVLIQSLPAKFPNSPTKLQSFRNRTHIGHVSRPLCGSICIACRTTEGSRSTDSNARKASFCGMESSSRIHTESAPRAKANSIASSTPPALPRFSAMRWTISGKGKPSMLSKAEVVPSVETLSATITRSGGLV